MAITSADIKLMQPERLTDDEDGGGQMTGLEVIDGDINNLFEDISRVNRTYGNVSLRKSFLKVDTPTADLYLDAHAILSAQPADPNVSSLLFITNDFYDHRDAARQRIEAFVIPGPITGFHLRGTQLQGQRTIILYSPAINNQAPPEVGDTLMLQVGDNLNSQQFVKILNVDHSQQNFTYDVSGGAVRTFLADQYIVQISADLKQDYVASDPHPQPSSPTRVYSTQSAASAKYYGTTTLLADAQSGSSSVRVKTTFAPIIPTASSETPVIDQRPGGFVSHIVPSASSSIDVTVAINAGAISKLPTGAVPGSLSLTVGGAVYTDKGGEFVNSAGNPGALAGSTIDYLSGAISWAASQGTVTLSYRPGALRQQLPNTGKIEIDDTNRNFNYVLSLDPPPSPTTFHVSYQYLGKWYEIHDDGTGALVGDGSGQINYSTGSIIVTLQAQPDANSVLFYRWTNGSMYHSGLDGAFSDTAPVYLSLSNQKIFAGSVVVSWVSGGNAKTAEDTDGDGTITGDATGTINYAEGKIMLVGAPAPDAGTGWVVSYSFKPSAPTPEVNAVPSNDSGSDITLESAAGVAKGSIFFTMQRAQRFIAFNEFNVEVASHLYNTSIPLSDDGNGNIVNRADNKTVGFVNYITGQITIYGTSFLKINNDAPFRAQLRRLTEGKTTENSVAYVPSINTTYYYYLPAQNVDVFYSLASSASVETSETVSPAASPWRFMLAEQGPVVPGSVILSIAGERWFDDGEGRVLRNYNTTTGTGTPLGTIDYDTTEVVISQYAGRPNSAAVTPIGLVIGSDWSVVRDTSFRTVAAPLRPNGFTVRGDEFGSGMQYNGQADSQGVITGDGIVGEVDLQKGIADISFPMPVFASTVFYNAVAFKQIPLDPEILGLDPVRLPADGRVPIVRDADILVLTHTARDLIETPTDGLVIDAGRDRLHDAWIEDQLGTRLDPEQYVVDKDAGTATLADPFSAVDADSAPLVGDLYFVHRVDDMALCTEARIDGTLQLAQPLYHDLPANETWVASAIYLGDLRARVKDWKSTTTDPGYDGGGIATNAQYNLIAYPVAIDNRGSVPERWKIVFTSTTAFNLFGEKRGLVIAGSTAVDFSPINPQSGTPYFTIKADGWGSGWQVGNTVRFDTDAAAAPLWMIRTVLPGQATVDDDQIKIELRGDHN